jgi:hypothetical protein
MDELNENCTGTILIEFYDQNRLPVSPSQFFFKIIDSDSGEILREEQTINNPPSKYNLEILLTDTVILNQRKLYELRKVICRFTYGDNKSKSAVYTFKVKNLRN